jgi:hypothetical protein
VRFSDWRGGMAAVIRTPAPRTTIVRTAHLAAPVTLAPARNELADGLRLTEPQFFTALTAHRAAQLHERMTAGPAWHDASAVTWLTAGGEVDLGGDLLAAGCEGQLQDAGAWIEPGQEPEGEFFVVAVPGTASEVAHVHAAEVVFGAD